MADSRVFTGGKPSPQAGIISKIRLENFMCHSSLEIELGDRVNFVTGQNGSGKSAILTALCVAFGCRARGTQRATTMKDFIKNSCSYALVHVELKNHGQDAFRPDKYGDLIVIERRINESSTTTTLKDRQGKKIAGQSKDLRELVEHFNIDVENPCVIMTQDKSREFLHSGNNKDKFKATLLHQVDALLKTIEGLLHGATELVRSLEESISPVLKELDELQAKIKSMEHIEEISQQVQLLKKKLAWTWVYDVDKQLQQQSTKIEKLQAHISTLQARVDQKLGKVEELRDHLAKKRAQIANMVESTSEVTRKKEELQQSLSLAARERLELEEERGRKISRIQKLMKQINTLEQQIYDINEQRMKDTQAEEYEMGQKLKELQDELDETNLSLGRLKKEEDALSESLAVRMDEIKRTTSEIEEFDRKCREISFSISDLRLHQTNKVTAFGGNKVINLLQAIERHAFQFKRPPIGPIGAHLALKNGDMWAPAVENAIGKLLQAFIVTDHKDSLLLRSCAREANYHNLQIIVYDFSRPRLHIPSEMLPQTKHQTILSVVHSENSTVINVLIDVGNVERQVLVRDYDVGKLVAFDQRILNLKEVYTLEGHRMFSRGSSQTILPPNKNARSGRLCSSYDEQIKNLRRDDAHLKEQVQLGHAKKRNLEEAYRSLQDEFQRAKRRRVAVERELNQKTLKLQDMKTSYAVESSAAPVSTVDELQGEFSKFQNEKQVNEKLIENIEIKMKEAETRANNLKISFQNLCESAKADIDALEEAERELMQLEDDLQSAEAEKQHYENIISEKLPSDIKEAESQYRELQETRKESYRKASIICAESEIQELGGCHGNTPEQLSAQLSRLNQRLQRESQRYPEPIDDLKMLYEKKMRKIQRKQQTYKAMRDKVDACRKAIDLRWCKFQRNATQLRRQLTWQFNRHLGKKGISGSIKVSYQEETLSVEVKMPHDASSSSVRDTRGLSGGERSFSTLCFAMALHDLTEAPFRAMDEFDVFMDAVSRKISLDTLVDFALQQGSQWIFITPHDISMVKQDERIKKQQLAAPRS